MQLTFLYHPVKDVEAAVAFYRDVLGMDEAWRMGDETAAFTLPGSDVELMLDLVTDSEQPGGFFGVDDVDRFFQDHKDDISFTQEPIDNGPIRYAAFHDVSGHLIRVFHELAE